MFEVRGGFSLNVVGDVLVQQYKRFVVWLPGLSWHVIAAWKELGHDGRLSKYGLRQDIECVCAMCFKHVLG